MMKFIRTYLLPGLLFQSVVIAGGYATGRELVEFFLHLGPLAGLLAMAVTTVVWSVVIAVTFELSRVFKSYDYRSFFQVLLGRAWVLFELCYLTLLFLILAIITKASGEMVAAQFDVPSYVGTTVLMLSITLLTFYGSNLIEKVLASWSFVLYVVYFIFLYWGLGQWGDIIFSKLTDPALNDIATSDWFSSGVKYAGYNLAVIPSILFCIRHLSSRKEAIGAGLLAGLLAIIPGICFYLLLVAFYPSIENESVPVTSVLAALDSPWFSLVFNVVIFGTFIETGTALLHAVNERVAAAYQHLNKPLPKSLRPTLALSFLLLASYLGNEFGLINLIAQGYGVLTYGFIALFVVPVLSIGVYKLMTQQDRPI